MTQRVIVSGFILKNGKTLILKRGKDKKVYPNVWEHPGGHLEKGEAPIEGIIREVKEETSLDVEVLEIYHVWDYDIDGVHYVQLAFLLKPLTGKIILEPGHDDFAWVTKDDLDNYEMTPEMKIEIEKGFDFVQNHI